MNELLREIAVKAQVEHCISHVRLQEFADLIVKECGVALNPPVQNRNVISRGQAYELIKKHFGLKE